MPPGLLAVPAGQLDPAVARDTVLGPFGPDLGHCPRVGEGHGRIARLVEEGERQADIERQRWQVQREQWRREEEARRAAKALKDSKEELLQVIDTWAEAKRHEAFFADAERRAQDLPEE